MNNLHALVAGRGRSGACDYDVEQGPGLQGVGQGRAGRRRRRGSDPVPGLAGLRRQGKSRASPERGGTAGHGRRGPCRHASPSPGVGKEPSCLPGFAGGNSGGHLGHLGKSIDGRYEGNISLVMLPRGLGRPWPAPLASGLSWKLVYTF